MSYQLTYMEKVSETGQMLTSPAVRLSMSELQSFRLPVLCKSD
jgi:hypothetical protein